MCNDDHLNLGKLNKWQIPVLFGDYLVTMMTLHLRSLFQRAKRHVVEIMKHLLWLEAVIRGSFTSSVILRR